MNLSLVTAATLSHISDAFKTSKYTEFNTFFSEYASWLEVLL